MTTSGVGSTSSTGSGQSTDAPKTGFAALDSNTFLKLLIVQLQNQDPTEPVGNDEILQQLTSMQSLQSNLELSEAVKAISSNQQLSTAATFIGRAIIGTSTGNELVSGIADRAYLKDGAAYVGIGDVEVPLSKVTEVVNL